MLFGGRELCLSGKQAVFVGFYRHGGINRIFCQLIIILPIAVAFDGVLSCDNGNCNTVNRKVHIIVSGGFLHAAFNHKRGRGLTRFEMIFRAERGIAHRPFDNFVKLGVAHNSAYLHLILKGEIAVVFNAECGKLIAAARLPKDFFGLCTGGLFEIEGFALGIFPCAVGLLHFESHIKSSRTNGVDARGCGVGEPCEGGSDKHCKAQRHCNHA